MNRRVILSLFFLIPLIAGKVALDKKSLGVHSYHGPDLEPLQAGYQAESLKRFSFGFENLISALLWVQVLQEPNHTPVKSNTVSWEFAQLNAITTLDPNFDTAYHYGALYVSFFRRDKTGGKLILEKWVQHRPTYWRSHYMLGMHHFLELHDYEQAAPHILRASIMPGAPEWISSLGIRLLTSSGSLYAALQSSIELLPSMKDPDARFRLLQKIRGIRWNLQKKSWEEALEKYLTSTKHAPESIAVLSALRPPKRELASIETEGLADDETKPFMTETFRFKYDPTTKMIVPNDPQETKLYGHMGAYDPEAKNP